MIIHSFGLRVSEKLLQRLSHQVPLSGSFPKGKQENYLTQSNKCGQHSICYRLSTALREPKPWLESNPRGCLLFDPEKYWSLIHNVTSLQVLEDFGATSNSSRAVKVQQH